nr:sperm flagellar protein 2-like [Vanessa tameamea]
MAEILKEWLSHTLQHSITWEAKDFGDKMKNGHIISCVLRSYNVINEEKHYLIKPNNINEDIKNNWKLLTQWLLELEINLSDTDLANVMAGQGSSILRLFYKLFLCLDKRDRTNFIKRERKMCSNLVEKIEHRFTVKKLKEEEDRFVDHLAKPLLDENQFIEWQREKSKQIQETYDYLRHKYLKTLKRIEESQTPLKYPETTTKKITNKDKKDMDIFSIRYPCKFHDYTYEELCNLDEAAKERKKSIVDSEWTKNYLDNLHSRIHKKTDSEEFQKQISNVISGSLWDMSVAEEEAKLDIELAKKVMKLSQFEKQMCTQIMETKQQARNLVQNRIAGEEEFAEQRTQQFNQFLDNLKEDINLGLVEIDFEKQRQNTLHKKLYAEKMKRKRQHYYDICYETILSIIDYATKYAYYKRLLEGDIPNQFITEWKALYYKQQPIFDYLESMENILKEPTTDENQTPDYEEILHLELDRQEVLNKSEFKDYHNYLYPWSLDLLIPNFDPESEDRKYEYLGSRILGHVVYSLLEIKYPLPPQRLPATLPNYSAKAIVRNLPDNSITIAMQTLLNAQKIHVVRLETAINFCLRKFKTELIGCTDIELSFDKFIASAQEEDTKEFIKLLKSEDEIVTKISEANLLLISGPLIANTKQTQTPKAIPEEDISLSSSAELGRYAYECLNSGNILTDHLICAILVEYLKDQDNINGFVIINYPNSYYQAQILEETCSGRAPPDEIELDDQDDIYLEESIIKHRIKKKDPYLQVRISELVNDPHKKLLDKPFTSYFSCYIKLKETEDILQEFVIWNLDEENSELIDRFYAVLGINYSMYYEVIEKEQLGLICKYIIGDFSMPLKSNDKLFGENVLSILDFPSSDEKRMKSKIVKPEVSNGKSKEKLRRNSKLSKLSSLNDLNIVKAPDSIEDIHDEVILESVDEEENESKTYTPISIEDVKLLAGEEDWIYGELPIPEVIGIALATCWEEIEKTYIHDMKHLFFAKRLQMNCLVPYTRFLKDKMEQIITLPSQKQDLVSSFQQEYNNFENDWRDIHFSKNEWHCKVKELQQRLYKICDERKLFAEQQRHMLICENWALEEMTTMVNTYISCMQTELNRAMLTYQTLHDFYFAMIKRSPSNDRITSKELNKIFKETDETSGSKKGGEDKLYRQLKTCFQEMQLKNIEIDFSNNPFHFIIESNVKFALKSVKETNDSYRSIISREYSELAKIVPTTKKKEDNNSVESLNEEEIYKNNALKCIEEWIMGINGEMFRVSLRLLALQYKCYKDIKLFNDNICKTFTDIQNDINNYYLNEIKSVDRLCKYLQLAVEGGKRIPESLALEEDMFIIDANLLQFSASKTEVDTAVTKEFVADMQFKICHLARLRSQFKIVAPTGLILQQAFIYLLQDFIFFGREICDGPMFPEVWKRIDPDLIPKLVFSLFGEATYIDWRDFLIFCLNLPFPTVDELLLHRKHFRCNDLESSELIERNTFIEEQLWFEKDYNSEDKHDLIRKNLIKHFLFELFETADNVMNYSAFLLAVCKNVDPIEGFVMALSMAIGKNICFKLVECKEIVSKLIRDKKYKDECLVCAYKCTGQFLDKLITNVINTCEGTSIIELEYTEPVLPESDKKGKKGKGGTRAKKIESTQSARIPKVQKSLTSRSKIAESTIDVKMTYICKPCEEDVEVIEEKLSEKEEIIEEEKVELQKDPNLAYVVSQSDIWKVLHICLPSFFQLQPEVGAAPYIEHVKEAMQKLEDDDENKDIFVCKFVSEPNICKILHKTKKFCATNLADEVHKIISI